MSSNQGERFSNEQYLTMNQVSRALGTTLIDDIWKEVLSYRALFTSTLTLRTVERHRLKVVLTPKISDRMNQLDRRMSRIQVKINELSLNPAHQENLKILLYRDILRTVAHSYDIDFNDQIVNQLIGDSISVLSAREMFLNDYFRGLELIASAKERPFNKQLLADIGRLFNVPPLNNYLYRTTEEKTGRQSLINHTFNYVPTNQIEEAINDFVGFIQNRNLTTIVESAAIVFYLDYIKPFEIHSELIAILMAKTYLAQQELYYLAPYINFELLLEKYKEARDEIFHEVKKSSDLTYFVDLLINVLNESLATIEEHIIYVTTHELEAEALVSDEDHPEAVHATPTDLFGYAKEAHRETARPESLYKPKPGATVLPKEEPYGMKVTAEEAGLGISELPPTLSENDILRLERHLRESDPSLSRAEAYFYARHCTLGKYYTINDFKEVTGCAYETARTSMEHLADSGYYRKEKFKNKFIYTPLKKE